MSFGARIPLKCCCALPKSMRSLWLNLGGVPFHHWVLLVSDSFSTESLLFSLCNEWVSYGKILRYVQILCFSLHVCPLIGMLHPWVLLATITTVVFAEWWSSSSAIPLTFINQNSDIKKSCFFPHSFIYWTVFKIKNRISWRQGAVLYHSEPWASSDRQVEWG